MESKKKMTTAIEHLAVLHNNPFIFAPVLAEFFSEFREAKRSMLLAYLVLPLVLPEEPRKYLRTARIDSSLRILLKERARIHGLAARIQQYRRITDNTLQYLVDATAIDISQDLSVAVTGLVPGGMAPDGAEIAARNLAKLCRPYDVQTIYRMLGVKSL